MYRMIKQKMILPFSVALVFASCALEDGVKENSGVVLNAQMRTGSSGTEYSSLQPGAQVGTYIVNNGKTYVDRMKSLTEFVSGRKYVYNITINADDLKVEMTGNINGWNFGDTIVTEDIS